MRNFLSILLISAGALSAQSLSVGVIGGAPFSDVVNNSTASGLQAIAKSTNFTIGPSLQVGLPAHLRIEVDALSRPYSFNLVSKGPNVDVSANQFRFPVLLQYSFGTPLVRPFLEAGLSFDHLSGLSTAAKSITSGPGKLLHQSDAGLVLGAGADVRIPFFRVSGELRFTRQAVSNFDSFSNLNQAEILFGIHF